MYDTPDTTHTGILHDLPVSTEERPFGNVPPAVTR